MAGRRSPARRALALLVPALLALFSGKAAAEVWLGVEGTAESRLAAVLGTPERRPRDLVVNGRALAFTPYRSERTVAEIADDWAATLAAGIRPAIVADTDPHTKIAAIAATSFLLPRVMKPSEDFATVVQFFDGDGPAALAYFQARTSPEAAAAAPPSAMPGIVVTIRRPAGAEATEVQMTRLEDVPGLTGAFSETVDADGLPAMLRPPPGAEVLLDLTDEGGGHRSRSIVTEGSGSALTLAHDRAARLAAAGFSVDMLPPRGTALAILRGRNGPVEADVVYTTGESEPDILEVVHLREPLAEGNAP